MDAVELAGMIAAEVRLRDRVAREAYERGLADGRRDGYEQAAADWKVTLGADPGGVTHAELERRRWSVRGERRTRETFAEPHAADYTPRSQCRTAA